MIQITYIFLPGLDLDPESVSEKKREYKYYPTGDIKENHNVQYILSKCTQKGDRAMHHGINPSSLDLLQLNKYLLTLKSTSLKVQCQLVPEERGLVL